LPLPHLVHSGNADGACLCLTWCTLTMLTVLSRVVTSKTGESVAPQKGTCWMATTGLCCLVAAARTFKRHTTTSAGVY